MSDLARRWLFVLLALACSAAVLLLPLPAARQTNGELIALSTQGRISLAIVALCLILWVTEAIPFAATGLVVFLLFPALGVATPGEVAGQGLGHPVILFFLSVLLLAVGFVEVGLGQRVSNWILLLSGGRPQRLILLTLAAGAGLAMGINAIAATAILLSTARDILKRTSQDRGRTNFSRGLLIAVCWGPLIGSVGTPSGAGANPLTIGYLRELAGVEVSFLGWMALGLPVVLLLVPLAWQIICRTFPSERQDLLTPGALADLRLANATPLTVREKRFLVLYAVTFLLWIGGPAIARLSGGRFAPSVESIGLAAALIMFLPGMNLVSWKVAEREIQWGTLLVLAGGLAAGVMLYRTGAARWLAWLLLQPIASQGILLRLSLLLAVIALCRLVFTSATAAAAILVPVVLAFAMDLGLDPWLYAAAAAFMINLAMLLPTQSVVGLMAFSADRFAPRDMLRGGVPLLVLSALIVIAMVSLHKLFG